MRISDLSEDQIKIGMKVRSMTSNKIGIIVSADLPPYDTYWHIQWEGDDKPYSGFYWNHCECEVVE